jgi:lysophospholipase L1-like esterase
MAIGDSYTYSANWIEPVARSLRKRFGDAGGGYINLRDPYNRSCAVVGDYSTVMSGTWADFSITATTLDMGYAYSSTAGSKVTLSTTVARALSQLRLYYVPTADGQVRYRWNGGAWTALDLSGSTLFASVLLAGLPTAAAAWTLEVEVVSGTVRLNGFEARYPDNGVRINKVGQNGSQAYHWSRPTATGSAEWQSAVAAMDIDLFTIMLGANDQPNNQTQALADYLLTIVNNCKLASPVADVMVVMQPENHLGRTTPMTAFALAVRNMCVANKIPFMDTQYGFGDTTVEYAQGGIRDFLSDGMHPDSTKGGFVMGDMYYRAITQGF